MRRIFDPLATLAGLVLSALALGRLDAAAMDAELSEGLFKSYLDLLGLRHERHMCVHGDKNVDFHIDGETPVLCDVKEIRPSPADPDQIDAYSHLRDDLRRSAEKVWVVQTGHSRLTRNDELFRPIVYWIFGGASDVR